MLASLAPQYGCEIVSIVDPLWQGAHREITPDAVREADVCIEFSHPSVVMQNIRKLIEFEKNMVIGTTGWHDKLPEVRDMALQKNVGLLYGSNFSIGMNLFLRVVANAVREFDKFNEYDVFGYELHHNQKADSPSGTAITLSDTILDASTTKQTAVFEKLDRKIEPDELHFASIRAGRIPGTHLVGFDSEADTIELTHRVRNRSCFAVGALKAALWLHGKQGVYSFQDMMAEVLC